MFPGVAAPIIGFGQAKQALRLLRLPGVDEATTWLERWNVRSTAVSILSAYAPDRLPAAIPPPPAHAESESDIDIETSALRVLYDVFPIELDSMAEDMYNDGEINGFGIVIEVQGLPLSYDELDVVLMEPEAYDMREHRALMICKYLDLGADSETWQAAAGAWHWPDGLWPEYLDHAGPIRDFDSEGLRNRLEQAGLPEFTTLFDVTSGYTENIFMDYYRDQAFENPWPFTMVSIITLAEIWKSARPILDACLLAEKRAQEEPDVLFRLVDAWNASVIWDSQKRPKTLVDLFADDDAGERVIDPFYGPLDGLDEEFEADYDEDY